MVVASCVLGPPTETPIPTISFENAGSNHKTLVVMLPGRGDRAETLVREGFESAGEKHGFDTVMVDAHFGYYRKRVLIPRLQEDVIEPARRAGYESIWLLGVSMGGLGSVLYAANHPEEVDGVILLAPFLGDEDVIEEVSGSGGLDQWNPENSELRDFEIEAWTWLQTATGANSTTQVILGYGLSDGLADSYPVLLERLDNSQVYTMEGGHGWKTWRPLWEEIAAQQNF